MRRVITVDGLAGSGKTTLARLLAERLGWVHFNSGLLYRAAAWLALKAAVDLTDPKAVCAAVKPHEISLKADAKKGSLLIIDGVDLTESVRSPEVSEATSKVAALAQLRDMFVSYQREAFKGSDMVAEGRDMGTVIFPDSPLKFFIVADESVRIDRRFRQLYGPGRVGAEGPPADPKSLNRKIQIEIRERDARDSTRSVAPTVAAKDAVEIDNSVKELTLVVEDMYSAALSRGLV